MRSVKKAFVSAANTHKGKGGIWNRLPDSRPHDTRKAGRIQARSEQDFYKDSIIEMVEECKDLYTLRMVYTNLCHNKLSEQENKEDKPHEEN